MVVWRQRGGQGWVPCAGRCARRQGIQACMAPAGRVRSWHGAGLPKRRAANHERPTSGQLRRRQSRCTATLRLSSRQAHLQPRCPQRPKSGHPGAPQTRTCTAASQPALPPRGCGPLPRPRCWRRPAPAASRSCLRGRCRRGSRRSCCPARIHVRPSWLPSLSRRPAAAPTPPPVRGLTPSSHAPFPACRGSREAGSGAGRRTREGEAAVGLPGASCLAAAPNPACWSPGPLQPQAGAAGQAGRPPQAPW